MSKSILIVDDDLNFAKALKRVLAYHDYDTSIATSGFEAGIAIAINKPDLITLDIQMPQMSGAMVLEVLRSMDIFDRVKVLIISASHENEMRKLLSLGADDYLAKPYEDQLLLEKVAKLLASLPEKNDQAGS